MGIERLSESKTALSRYLVPGVICLLGALALALGIALHPLAVDDAYITFRYAQNLAMGRGFTYNVGSPVLGTTTPLYALLLSLGGWLGFDVPVLANALSALALGVGAVAIVSMGRREQDLHVGILAALMYVLYPLLWLSLGLETAIFLTLGLGAVAAYHSGRFSLAAALLALATLTRGDGLILILVLASDFALGALPALRQRLRQAGGQLADQAFSVTTVVRSIAVYALVVLPVVGWLSWQFGSPLPATLQAKRAQAVLGITGFYPHTTYLEGLGILVRARLAQSPLYVLFVPAVLIGLPAAWRRRTWVRLIVAWGLAHLVGYAVLGVTPYYWYYAPLVPGLVCAASLGVVECTRWLRRRSQRVLQGLGGLWAALLLVALVGSDWAVVQALDGPVLPPDDPVSKVLPEAKATVYELAGRWLHKNTPPDALVGVTEVGIMGYYSQRAMLDFLGLLEPDVASALARGDLYWGLLRFQPDYLALTAVSPLYAYDLRADSWFQAAYRPIERFDDSRFWGTPLVVYERQLGRVPLVEATAGGLPQLALRLETDVGGQIRLLGGMLGDETVVQPGDVLTLTLYWQAREPVDRDYTVFVHLLGQYDRVIAQRDAAPGLGARPTSGWTPGQVVVDPYLLALPEAAYAPDEAVWEVGLYDATTGKRLQTPEGQDNVRFGAISVQSRAEPLHLDFGAVVLTGYELDRLALAAGETLHVSPRWTGEGPVRVTVRLVGEAGSVAGEFTGDLEQRVYSLMPGTQAGPGAYDLEVLLQDPVTGNTLPLLGADGQPQSDHATLTKIRLYP
jgi:hypothetical protein